MKFALTSYVSTDAPPSRRACVVPWIPHGDLEKRARGLWDTFGVTFYGADVETAKIRAREFMGDIGRKVRENAEADANSAKGRRHELPEAFIDAVDELVESASDAVQAQTLGDDCRDAADRLDAMQALERRVSGRLEAGAAELRQLAAKHDGELK